MFSILLCSVYIQRSRIHWVRFQQTSSEPLYNLVHLYKYLPRSEIEEVGGAFLYSKLTCMCCVSAIWDRAADDRAY